MTDIKIKAAELPCDTETAQWDKLSDEALANMEKKLTDEQKDRLIVEALGESMAVWFQLGNNLATPEGFFWIWPRLKKDKKLFREFIQNYLVSQHEWDEPNPWFLPLELVDYIRFRDALAEFLEGRE